jgi:hypothetical protein
MHGGDAGGGGGGHSGHGGFVQSGQGHHHHGHGTDHNQNQNFYRSNGSRAYRHRQAVMTRFIVLFFATVTVVLVVTLGH